MRKANLQQNLAYYHNCIKEHMLSQDTYDQKSTVEGEKQAYYSIKSSYSQFLLNGIGK